MQHPNLSRTAVAAALIAMGGMVASLGYAAGTGPTDTSTATGTKAATSETSKGQTGSALKAGDRKFVTKAAEGGIAEVQLGKLAQQKASNDQVKQFGQRMVTDHGSANEKLKAVASGKGISLPAQMDTSAQKEYDKLSKLSGVQKGCQRVSLRVALRVRQRPQELRSEHAADARTALADGAVGSACGQAIRDWA